MIRDEKKRLEGGFAEGALSILSVLRHDSREVLRIHLHPNVKREDRNVQRLLSLARKKKIPIQMEQAAFFDENASGHTHGGVMASVGERRMISPEEVFDCADGFVFLICGIEDPFNFGCAVRSFYAAGAGGMILTPRNWLSASSVTMRSSAGTTEALPCAVYEDAASLCRMAKEKEYRIVCASETDSEELYCANLSRPIFLIVGGEKRGITKEFLLAADQKVRIPYGRAFRGSLTASAAAAICAFEVLRQQKQNM